MSNCAGGFMSEEICNEMDLQHRFGMHILGVRDSAVHAPKHYALGSLGCEAIDVIQASLGPEGFKAYCLGNVLKYTLRHDKKNGKEDLEKALKYLEWAINGKA